MVSDYPRSPFTPQTVAVAGLKDGLRLSGFGDPASAEEGEEELCNGGGVGYQELDVTLSAHDLYLP